jgi:cytoskeletal protein CcmA (bactofilin family)
MITRHLYTSTLLFLSLSAATADAAVFKGGRLIVTDGGEDISTTFLSGSTGYSSKLYIDNSGLVSIGTGNVTPDQTTYPLGLFPEGELAFSIFVTNTSKWFYSGPRDRNGDEIVHASISDNTDGTFTVGFEDFYGGGDRDYNDINFSVTGGGLVLTPEKSCAVVEFMNYSTTLPAQTVFANTYVSAGAGSAGGETVHGNILANTYVTMGAGSKVTGDIKTGTILTTGASATVEGSTWAAGASTLGASSKVYTDLQSGTAVTLGASSQVQGDLEYGTVVTYGASATAGADAPNTTAPVIIDEHQGVLDAQSALDSMAVTTTIAPGNIAVGTTFAPGVYDVNGLLTVTAGVTLTLDAQGTDGDFIFNISNYLTFGAGVNVVVINGTDKTRVIWNATGGYVSIGASANIVGTILAKEYVSTGANSSVTGVGECSGAVYSGASYVSIGAGAVIGASAVIGAGAVIGPVGQPLP